MRRMFCRFVYWLIEPLLDRIEQGRCERSKRQSTKFDPEGRYDITLAPRTDQTSAAGHHLQ